MTRLALAIALVACGSHHAKACGTTMALPDIDFLKGAPIQ